MIHISKDGSGDFESIQKALDSLPQNGTAEYTLFIHKGVYEEQITITTPHVTFLGEDKDHTILTYGLYAHMPMEDGMKRERFEPIPV